MESFAREKGIRIELQWFNDTPKKQLFARAARLLMLPPSAWAWASVYVLDRTQSFGAAATSA
jgi:hypothetical protein